MSDGGLAISSQVVIGTNAAYSGDIRTGETYASDQSSQIEVTSTQLSGGQWIGAGGQSPKRWPEPLRRPLLVEQRQSCADGVQAHQRHWTELGSPYASGALAAGTR